MKALITGGGGFAGSHLGSYLAGLGMEVTLLDRRLRPRPGMRVVRADLRDAAQCENILREVRPQRIYHLAAVSSNVAAMDDPQSAYSVNFTGTLNLLSAWRRVEMDCRLLLVSTSEVHGASPERDMPLHENAALSPSTPYAASKAASEMAALQFFLTWGLPIVVVRPFSHTGPGQTDRFVCSSFARQLAEIAAAPSKRRATISVGNLNLRRDFSDVRDIVRGYHLLLEKGQPGQPYFLCSGRAVSLAAILQTLRECFPTQVDVLVDPKRLRSNETPAIWGDYSKAQQATGWSPTIPLETTLQELAQYWASEIKNRQSTMLERSAA
jgi:GDP-4-dehydro-6-deoxy-D-mannose reductase